MFDRLHELQPGDFIYVNNNEGSSVRFVVTKISIYAPDTDASEVFGPSFEARLNLITCDGDWDARANSYSKRLVVFLQ